jgi:peptide/nickel transport system ATP-binding protein
VLVRDELTAALDVSVRAAILELLAELQSSLDVAMRLITHDLGVVSATADRVTVLELGQICATGAVSDLLVSPQHPYTRRLLAAAPRMPDHDAG